MGQRPDRQEQVVRRSATTRTRKTTDRCTTFRANNGGEARRRQRHARARVGPEHAQRVPVSRTSVRDRWPYQDLPDQTPAKRYLLRSDYNLTNSQQDQLPVQPARFARRPATCRAPRPPASAARSAAPPTYLHFGASNYTLLENIKSGIGEWNCGARPEHVEQPDQSGYTIERREPRRARQAVSLRRHPPGRHVLHVVRLRAVHGAATSCATSTFQLQDNFTKFGEQAHVHLRRAPRSGTIRTTCSGAAARRATTPTTRWPTSTPTRTTTWRTRTGRRRPSTLRRFKVRYSNVPGLEKPLQPLTVWYSGGYVQDEWRPRTDLTVTAGVRLDALGVHEHRVSERQSRRADVPRRGRVARPVPDRRDARHEDPVVAARGDQLGRLRTTAARRCGWAPVSSPVRRFTSGFRTSSATRACSSARSSCDNTTAFPFSPNSDRYKPTNVTGEGASSFELNVTDPDFKFPQVWRTNVAVDHRLPWGIVGTVEYLYNKDVNGIVLHQREPAGGAGVVHGTGQPAALYGQSHQQHAAERHHGALRAEEPEHRQVVEPLGQPVEDACSTAVSFRGAYSYGESQEHDRSWIHGRSRRLRTTSTPAIPTTRGSATRDTRRATGCSCSHLIHAARTSASARRPCRRSGKRSRRSRTSSSNVSYVFAGDMNGDGVLGQRPDLHPEQHVRDELPAVHAHQRHTCSRRMSRRRRSRPTSSRTRT